MLAWGARGAAADANPGRDFSASDLNRLPLLSAVIKEALRLCGPAPLGGSREVVAEEGADLCGFHVENVRCTAKQLLKAVQQQIL